MVAYFCTPLCCCWLGSWSAPAGAPLPAVQDTQDATRALAELWPPRQLQQKHSVQGHESFFTQASDVCCTAPSQVLHLLLECVETKLQYDNARCLRLENVCVVDLNLEFLAI